MDFSFGVLWCMAVRAPLGAAMLPLPGRELWTFQSGGQLLHVTSKKCAGKAGAAAGSGIVMMPCDGADAWELAANGQVQVGSLCLSQSGPVAGVENAAAHAAATATSTADASAHGAAAAVDLNEASYWASKFDEDGPVELSIDLGSERQLTSMRISWEFPAKAFAVALSDDGEHWSEVFATSVNVESVTSLALGGRRASKVKLVMQEAHPLQGAFSGHVLYGVRSVTVLAPRLSTVVDDCATAAKSKDARDKYFASFVSEFDPAASQALQGELPALMAGKAALGAAVSEVMGRIPKAAACRPQPSSLVQALQDRPVGHSEVPAGAAAAFMQGGMAARGRTLALGLGTSEDAVVARAVDDEYGLGAGSAQQLLGTARSAIVKLRGLLQ